VVCCKADGSYTVLFFTDGHKEIKPINLKKISKLLPHGCFLRCHNSWLINRNMIVGFDIIRKKIFLKHEIEVPVSRRMFKQTICRITFNLKSQIMSIVEK
ncbi:MAG: LytTR family DNA-binding domain-containing protein, partial [Ignavibacterium sp.]